MSYLFLDSEAGIKNRDSLGTQNLIQPGGLHWTAAGSGVVHDEVPAVTGKSVHMLQIFVNLPEEKQLAAPFSLSLEPHDVPVVHLPGVKVRVPLGHFSGAHSPLQPPTTVRLLDISLEDKAGLSVAVPADHSAFVIPIFGTLTIDGQTFDASTPQVPIFHAQSQSGEVWLSAQNGPAQAVVFSGLPLRQPVHWRGSLAMASIAALNDRVMAYQRGEFGLI